MAVPQRGHLSS